MGMMFYQMLYGNTPWTGKTPYELYNNIRKQMLEFPSNIKRSPQVLDLIREMLQIEDADRISWKQIFTHPLVQLDTEQLEKEITQLASSGDIDSQVSLQELYFKNNSVINIKNTLNQEIKIFLGKKYQDFKVVENFFNFDSKEQLDFDSIISMQD